MKITLFNDEGYEIFRGTPGQVADGLRSGEINRSDLVGAGRMTEATPPPVSHDGPDDREHRLLVKAAGVEVRGGGWEQVQLWLDRANKVEGRCAGGRNPLAYADSLLSLAREDGCSEAEIRSFFGRALDFQFTEPETAKVSWAEFGSSFSPVYVLFDNGACYTHETKLSAHPMQCGAAWGGPEGLFIDGAKSYKIQPRKHDWIEGFLRAAYAANENPLPILRQITGWEWFMERGMFNDGTSSVHYRMTDESIREGRERPAISGSGLGCHNSDSGFFRVETAEAKRLQAINDKFRVLPTEGTAEEVADWLDGFSWRSPYKPRTVACFLREHWSGRTIRVETAHFSASARQGTITAEGWKFLYEGKRIACISSDGFFNNLGLKTPDELTATPVAAVLFGQGPVGCE